MGQTVIRSPYPPDVATANLFQLKNRPPQIVEARYLGQTRRLLTIHATEVHAEQNGPDHYHFRLQFELQHPLRTVISYDDLKLLGTVIATDGGSQLTLRRIDYLGRGLWSLAIFGPILTIGLTLYSIHQQIESQPLMIAFVWGLAIALAAYAMGLAFAFRRAVRISAIRLIEEAVGAVEAPITDWHTYLYPNEKRGQYYERSD